MCTGEVKMAACSSTEDIREPSGKVIDESNKGINYGRRKKAGLFSNGSYLFSSFRGTDATKSGIMKGNSSEEGIQAIKMDILNHNPAILNRFREKLVGNVYTHWGVSHCLAEFFDNELRIPELRDEIHSCCSEKSSRGGLLAYLTGETSPSSGKGTVRSLLGVTEGSQEYEDMQVPSLESTEASDDDDFIVRRKACVEGIRLEF